MQKDIIYRFHGSDEVYRSADALPVGGPTGGPIDLARMKEAIKGDSITMPKGLSREEKRNFILAHARP
jgi:hypothetical protein